MSERTTSTSATRDPGLRLTARGRALVLATTALVSGGLIFEAVQVSDPVVKCEPGVSTEAFPLDRTGNPAPAIEEMRRLNPGLEGASDSTVSKAIEDHTPQEELDRLESGQTGIVVQLPKGGTTDAEFVPGK